MDLQSMQLRAREAQKNLDISREDIDRDKSERLEVDRKIRKINGTFADLYFHGLEDEEDKYFGIIYVHSDATGEMEVQLAKHEVVGQQELYATVYMDTQLGKDPSISEITVQTIDITDGRAIHVVALSHAESTRFKLPAGEDKEGRQAWLETLEVVYGAARDPERNQELADLIKA